MKRRRRNEFKYISSPQGVEEKEEEEADEEKEVEEGNKSLKRQ